ncbi:hypothetical protein Poli38472_004517 [Pythium oligandrum]|uniref:Kinesin-like protein n=1 Tax=Pythium oligandrum TaxID=41045 RepID=A0A8K1CAK6_PYTOL|nr:hypothetical protein Poli38472_004517 [Pythium oligandrum]|eukprot:TMW59448.1 hypothetical protein Poli38472_004517 [Pythium oligandrum]
MASLSPSSASSSLDEELRRRRHETKHLRRSLKALKRDVASSFRICKRDFGVLGNELIGALSQKQEKERLLREALEYERVARRLAQTKLVDMQGSIRVMCRVRPLLETEKKDSRVVTVASMQDIQVQSGSSSSSSMMSSENSGVKSFSVDRIFHDEATQQQVFKEVQPLVSAAVDGQHACVFAYGQTGSGKTHTMQGIEDDPGIAYRAAGTIFEHLEAQSHLFVCTVRVQMVEIYNEELYDLLGSDQNSSSPLSAGNSVVAPFQTVQASALGPGFVSRRPLGEIRHGENGVYLRNVDAVTVVNPTEVLVAIEHGESNRAVHSMSIDEHCNRSHSVVIIEIQRVSRADGQVSIGRFVLVDLAGSERMIKSQTSGPRLREAQHINKSLAAISDVLTALLSKEKHVPYRNSKLTHLLQDSLGATDSQMLMIVHVSPSSRDVNETINTLKFAARASHVQNASTRRTERLEMNRLQGIIASQAAQLQALQEKMGGELELRRKYEKRLEEYRQEDHRRRAKENGQSTSPVPAPTTAVTTADVPTKTRIPGTPRRRLSASSTSKTTTPSRMHSGTGQENISENILRSQPTANLDGSGFLLPVPEKKSRGSITPGRRRRSSLTHGDRKPMFSPTRSAPNSGTKRKPTTGTPPRVRSILKKQRVDTDQTVVITKQVSFDLPSKQERVQTIASSGPTKPVPPLPPRQPKTLLRTPMNASRVPARVYRSATPTGLASPPGRVRSVGTPMRLKPKWNGWR